MPVLPPRAVVNAPLATAPRLAWARSISREDPSLAEFITASVDALRAAIQSRGDTPEGDALTTRAARLWRANRARWEPREEGVKLNAVRGAPEQVLATTDQWRRVGSALRARYPVLHLDAVGPGRGLTGHIDGLLSLALEGAQTAADVEALSDDPAFGELLWLDLSGTGLGLAAIDLVAARAPRLRHLGFERNPEGSPTAWWTDGDGALTLVGGGVAPRPEWGDREWLAQPTFRCAVLRPELYYPYPDL